MHDGLVSVDAVDATLTDILNEWARVGGSTIVNGELAKGAPLTFQLNEVPEHEALSVLLRSSVGYLAVTRNPQPAGTSQFARIVIMAPQAPAPVPAVAAARPVTARPAVPIPPEFSTPGVVRLVGPNGQPMADDQDGAPPFVPIARPPAGFTFGDEPARQRPISTASPSSTPNPSPTGPIGTSAPGMIMPAPQPTTPQQQTPTQR
jgi:hypothetical protein